MKENITTTNKIQSATKHLKTPQSATNTYNIKEL